MPDTVTPEQLDELERLYEAHSPETWEVAHGASYSNGKVTSEEWFVLRADGDVAIAADIIDPQFEEPSEGHARLIAALHNAFPALIRTIREQRAEIVWLTTGADALLDRVRAEAVRPYRDALMLLDALRDEPAPNYPEQCDCDRDDTGENPTLCVFHGSLFFDLSRETLSFMLVDMMAATAQYAGAIEEQARALLGSAPTEEE